MTTELKPCPFCNASLYECTYDLGKIRYAHEANGCTLSRKFVQGDLQVEAWNRRSNPVAEAVKVKPLEWNAPDSWNIAESVVGTYIVRPCLATNYAGQFVMHCGDEEKSSLYPSEEAAKNAAQADYEQRILSALEAKP